LERSCDQACGRSSFPPNRILAPSCLQEAFFQLISLHWNPQRHPLIANAIPFLHSTHKRRHLIFLSSSRASVLFLGRSRKGTQLGLWLSPRGKGSKKVCRKQRRGKGILLSLLLEVDGGGFYGCCKDLTFKQRLPSARQEDKPDSDSPAQCPQLLADVLCHPLSAADPGRSLFTLPVQPAVKERVKA